MIIQALNQLFLQETTVIQDRFLKKLALDVR